MSRTVWIWLQSPLTLALKHGDALDQLPCLLWREGSAEGRIEPCVLGDVSRQPEAAFDQLCVILPHEDVSLHHAQLAKKQVRHAQRILPFLLEDATLSHPSQADASWYVLGEPDEDSRYPVIAAPHQVMRALWQFCKDSRLPLGCVYAEGQLLSLSAPCHYVCDGTTYFSTAPEVLVKMPPGVDPQALLLAQDTPPPEPVRLTQAEMLQHLVNTVHQSAATALNLLRGPYKAIKRQTGQHGQWANRLWPQAKALVLPVSVMAGLVLVLMMIQTMAYHSEADKAFDRAAARYEQVFPGARATLKLRDQFGQRLRSATMTAGGGFSSLIDTVGEGLQPVLQTGTNKITDLRYDLAAGELLLGVHVTDYDQLEVIKQNMATRGFTVTIVNAQSSKDGVRARIKVSV